MMSFNVEDWKLVRERHPFIAESIGRARYLRVWDEAAERYTDAGVGPLKDMVVERMIEIGALTRESDVLDVGSGPGTYGTIFAQRCRSVVCVDSSQQMLDCLIRKGVANITCVRAEWESFDTDDRYDVVFSSLCPALNNPESLLKMESFSRSFCVYVSSMNDDRNSLRTKIWRAIGKDYTMNGYDTRYPFEYLRSIGREPTLDIFEKEEPFDMEEGDVLKKEIENLSTYTDVNEDTFCKVRQIVEDNSVDGVIHYDGRKRLGLLCWKV